MICYLTELPTRASPLPTHICVTFFPDPSCSTLSFAPRRRHLERSERPQTNPTHRKSQRDAPTPPKKRAASRPPKATASPILTLLLFLQRQILKYNDNRNNNNKNSKMYEKIGFTRYENIVFMQGELAVFGFQMENNLKI